MASLPPLDWISVAPLDLSVGELIAWATGANSGAIVAFSGTVRDSFGSHDEIEVLEYETSEELAELSIRENVDDARRLWPALGAVVAHHRTGRVALTKTAVVVVVSSTHRSEAFAAAQFCIDTLKESVPMWKRRLAGWF